MYINNNYSLKQTNNNSININTRKNYENHCTFTGANMYAVSERGVQKFEYFLRYISNRLLDLFENKKTKQITKNIAQTIPEANDKYLTQLEEISRRFSTKKTIDVNIEDKILEKIAASQKSTIFIMNHSNQKKDPSMLAVLNTLLSKAYKEFDIEKDYPLPKIILNRDILKTMNQTKRKAFEVFGAVGIDANIYKADKKANARVLLPLMKDFVKDKVNMFIFPEGKLAIIEDLDLSQRFQIGIAEFINNVLKIKNEVQVVPVGFSYGKGRNKELTGMHIGEPIKFKRIGEETTSTSGSILKSKFSSYEFKKFFEKHKDTIDTVITENGNPVKPFEIAYFIKSILAENLNICVKEANKQINKPLDMKEVYNI